MVVWLVHGVHGNEVSLGRRGAGGGLSPAGRAGRCRRRRGAARRAGADRSDAEPRWPRAVHRTRTCRDAPPRRTRRRTAAEHDEPWPGGRANHYLFDMNRDWFAQSQPETRGRITIGLEYQPQVTVDLHEQGGDNAYYFAPPAEPINPYITKSQIAGWRAASAAPMPRASTSAAGRISSARSTTRSTRATAIRGRSSRARSAMTYEQASARGLAFCAARRRHADLSRRRHAPLQRRHHHRRSPRRATASGCCATTSSTAAAPIAEGEKGADPRVRDRARARPVARRRCWRATWRRRASRCGAPRSRSRSAARTVPAGAYLVSNAQPTARMVAQPARSDRPSSRRSSSRSRKSAARCA